MGFVTRLFGSFVEVCGSRFLATLLVHHGTKFRPYIGFTSFRFPRSTSFDNKRFSTLSPIGGNIATSTRVFRGFFRQVPTLGIIIRDKVLLDVVGLRVWFRRHGLFRSWYFPRDRV